MAGLPKRLQRLEDDLARLSLDIDAMTLGEIDGFIAGILVCPVEIPADEWLAMLWRLGEATSGEDEATVAALIPQILEHCRLTSLELKASEEGYLPIFYIDDVSNETLWESWASGFGEAMQLRMESWGLVLASGDTDASAALDGITKLVTIASEPPPPAVLAVANNEREDLQADAPDLITVWVETLFDWRIGFRPDPLQLPVRSIKIGRNDPCPCGSGKKHKKCCGAAAA